MVGCFGFLRVDYLCKGLSKNYGRILWQENILNQVSYRDTLDFG
ncbi:hypothetical protein BSPCLSOX_2819 [uncultured Gammaproteobacteria bacterium]|nr:hypothetical protein BSPCLSOX_2819 [uncultured Gammaproteobacteria bacterium]